MLCRAFAREGSDAWHKYTAEEIMPDGYSCPDCGGTKFRKEADIMDGWFDSGVSHRAVLPNVRNWPGRLISLEGSDQYRLQTSMLTPWEQPARLLTSADTASWWMRRPKDV